MKITFGAFVFVLALSVAANASDKAAQKNQSCADLHVEFAERAANFKSYF